MLVLSLDIKPTSSLKAPVLFLLVFVSKGRVKMGLGWILRGVDVRGCCSFHWFVRKTKLGNKNLSKWK